MKYYVLHFLLISTSLFFPFKNLTAQQLEPRIYSNLPQKLNFLVLGDVYSSGGFVVDAALPVEDFTVKANQMVLAYARSLNIFGKSGQIQVLTPFVIAKAEAVLAGQDTIRNIKGFADPRIRIGWNLIGAPSKNLQEFGSYQQKSILGFSLQMTIPLGQYDDTRILNLGAYRWSLKPELGLSHQINTHFTMELYTGIWFFTNNDNYLGSSVVNQDEIWTFQAHLIYSIGKNKPWFALNGTFYSGGTTSIDDKIQNNFQSNYRIGSTIAYPLGLHHSLKASFSIGVSTRFGQSLSNFGLFYQYRWW